MRNLKIGLLVAAATIAMQAAPVIAATNLGFETGDLTGWTTNGGSAAAVTLYGAFSPVEGSYLGAIEAGLAPYVYTTLSQTFTLAAGGTISGYVGFQANDYLPYNDDAYLSVNGVNIFASNVGTVGDFGNSGWNAFSYTALTGGSYTLELGVRNQIDNGYSSGAVLDAVAVTGETGAVPEAATWAMMVVGFGLAGASLRSRRSAVSFG